MHTSCLTYISLFLYSPFFRTIPFSSQFRSLRIIATGIKRSANSHKWNCGKQWKWMLAKLKVKEIKESRGSPRLIKSNIEWKCQKSAGQKTKSTKVGRRKKRNKRMKWKRIGNGPKLISSRFNYNGTDNNIIRVWYPTMREIPSPPLNYNQWMRRGTEQFDTRGERR